MSRVFEAEVVGGEVGSFGCIDGVDVERNEDGDVKSIPLTVRNAHKLKPDPQRGVALQTATAIYAGWRVTPKPVKRVVGFMALVRVLLIVRDIRRARAGA